LNHNVFYVRTQSGVLRTVFTYWMHRGWNIDASFAAPEFNPTNYWEKGTRIFSHSSLKR
jgi:hypothetical protein